MAITKLPRRACVAKFHALTAPTDDQLADIASSVRRNELLPFIRALKRERSAASEARLVLMRMCADRAVTEDVRGNVDLALGEFRWGR